MELFDTHCHLNDEKFDGDLDEVLLKMKEHHVNYCLIAGCDMPTSRSGIALAEKYPGVYASVGIHPHEAEKAPENYLDELRELLKHPKVRAVGEIGLDYYYDFSPRDVQKKILQEQLDLAVETDKPCIFHIRDAHGDMIDLFRQRAKLPRGIIHCFSGSKETAKEYLRMGFYISFAGPLTFKKAPHLWEAVKVVPSDRLLIETDSPYLAPEPVRGRRNDPSNVRYVLEKMAALRETDAEEMARITLENARRIYGLM